MDPNAKKSNLVNKLNREQAISRLKKEHFPRKTISFYRYTILEDPYKLRDILFQEWNSLNVLGRIYLANEGINAQLSLPENNWDIFKAQLYCHQPFKNMPFKHALREDHISFLKLTIKVRNQIVADGLSQNEYDVTNVGKHLTAREWNEEIDQGAIVVDVRNHYESEVGRFQGAICPQVETFQDELPFIKETLKGEEGKKILLYCTGGIRCEKTSAYLKYHGFKDVNQLHGGIIDYARQLKKDKTISNKFKGKNFVFDERLAERISDEIISNCHQCEAPADTHVNCVNVNCNLLFIQCNSCSKKHKECCSPECINIIQLTDEQQKSLRAGVSHKKRFHSHKKIDLKKAFK
ncbi:MAG: rhodanese-related sulfurtransferase [Bacteroidota bacterium]|nr:rhodanese-related sulfurtransferase [Bacteroidota bacterium]